LERYMQAAGVAAVSIDGAGGSRAFAALGAGCSAYPAVDRCGAAPLIDLEFPPKSCSDRAAAFVATNV
jgi:hypothetical protein